MLLGLSNISYADSLKPTKTIKLNKSAFIADLAVYKGKLYYTDIKFKNPHKGPDGSVSYEYIDVKIYEQDIKNGKNNLVHSYTSNEIGKYISFKVLNNDELYMIYHVGGGIMGSDNIVGLTGKDRGKNILTYNYGNIAFDQDNSVMITPIGPWDNGKLVRSKTGKTYGENLPTSDMGNYFLEDITGSNGIFSYASPYSALRDNVLYLKKRVTTNSGHNIYNLIALNLDNGKETELAKNIAKIEIGKNEIYYIQDLPMVNDLVQPKKMLYKYDLNSKKTTLICEENNPYYEIYPMDKQVLFTGGNGFYTDDKKLNLFTLNADTKESKKVASNFNRIVSNKDKTALLYSNKKGSKIQVFDSSFTKPATINLPQTQVDIFLADGELIAWSWQNRSVNYYKLW